MSRIYSITIKDMFFPIKMILVTFKATIVSLAWQLLCMVFILTILLSSKFIIFEAGLLALILTLLILLKVAIHEYGHLAVAIHESKGLLAMHFRKGGFGGVSIRYSYLPPLSLLTRSAFYMGGPVISFVFEPILFSLGTLLLCHALLNLNSFAAHQILIVLAISAFFPILNIMLIYMTSKPTWKGDYGQLKRLYCLGLQPIRYKEVISVLKKIICYTFGKNTPKLDEFLQAKPVFNFPCEIMNGGMAKIHIDDHSHFCISGTETKLWTLINGKLSVDEITKVLGDTALEEIIKLYTCRLISLLPIYSTVALEELSPYKVDNVRDFYKQLLSKYFNLYPA